MGWDGMEWNARVRQPGTGPAKLPLSDGNNGIVVGLIANLGALSLSFPETADMPSCPVFQDFTLLYSCQVVLGEEGASF